LYDVDEFATGRIGDFVIEGSSVTVSAASPKEGSGAGGGRNSQPIPSNYHHSRYGNRPPIDGYVKPDSLGLCECRFAR
jgi:hypothetical protein